MTKMNAEEIIGITCECPVCGYDEVELGQNFCPNCGEVFEWKEE